MSLVPGSRLGPYQIVGPLGAGGMGEVYRAIDPRLGRAVAIKLLPDQLAGDPERMARLEREARLLAALNHPNIAQIYGFEGASRPDGRPVHFLAMELVEGEDLAARIQRGPVAIEETVAIGAQVAAALEEAHEKGIVHRDLKPANVKVTPEGKVKVLDFGLARGNPAEPGGSGDDLSLSPTLTAPATVTGMILGTAGYMSPEQARGRPVDRRADIWALGVLLYEMLAGRRAFTGESVTDVLAAILIKDVDWSRLPPETPPHLRALLRRCLDREPRTRLRDIGEARIALAAPAAEPTPESGPISGAAGSRPGLTGVIAGAIAGLILGGAATAWIVGRNAAAPAAGPCLGSIALPEKVTLEPFGALSGPATLSPDGRRIVFGARTGEERTKLWVRALDEAAPRPLEGTEGGHHPFWSPDGKHLGFFSLGALRRIPASGGPVTTLAPVADARGGSWSHKGVILFAPDFMGGLHRVPEEGGEIRPVTNVEAASSITHRYPFFLPDGDHFLYLARRSGAGPGREPSIMVGSLDGGEPRIVTPAACNASYGAGHLFYARGRTLIAHPFDPVSLALKGEPRPVVENLLVDERYSQASFSVSESGTLTYQTGRVTGLSQYLWLDRSGRRLGFLDEPGLHHGGGGIELSPDGTRCALPRIDPVTGLGDVWIVDLRSGSRQRLTNNEGDTSSPLWSPDGRRIVYMTFEPESAIRIRSADGSGEPRIVKRLPTRLTYLFTFAPDGRHVLIRQQQESGSVLLIEIPLDGSGAPRTVAAVGTLGAGAAFSPDGRWLAWSSNESGENEVYLQAYPGPGGRWQISREGGTEPRWRGDGRELFYVAADNMLISVEILAEGPMLSIGRQTPLFRIRDQVNSRYAVTRDGQRILANFAAEERGISPITFVTDWRALRP